VAGQRRRIRIIAKEIKVRTVTGVVQSPEAKKNSAGIARKIIMTYLNVTS
jgi:hypothetical protein